MTILSATSRKLGNSHSMVRWAAGGWTFFVVENAVLSENRTWLIDSMGDDNYHAFYGTFSTIATVSIGYAYYRITRKMPPASAHLRRWNANDSPPLAAGIGSWICMSVGLVMASQVAPTFQIPVSFSSGPTGNAQSSIQVRCPFDFADKRLETNNSFEVRGLERISRHPGLWSFGMIGMSQSLLAPIIPLQIWWLGPSLVAWLGGSHTDSRFRRGMGGMLHPEYDCQTSNIPFLAMITGKQSGCWEGLSKEIKPLNAALALAASSVW
eukprot:CAMPEP_0168169678 /NCGR_PEP_ID=MMETSP0139_2-20121125/3767_1 /TAXON_ID=44445 /ORGANISM="Pseudo-nitzschia australis, Strain 10249 10 AB" /LENGTH=266 /DNA_ID=CAMNT_0008087115 /DNA_START=85 /DNA_END=882 /DNA_ORIENTATION=+